MKSKGMFASSRAKKASTALKCIFSKLCILVVTSALIISSIESAHSAPGTLAWDAVNDPGVAGYKLHYGTVPGTYTNSVDTGKTTSITLFDLTEGKTYYFAATAYDSNGNQSGYSNEVSKSIPLGANYSLSVTKNGTGTGTVSGSGISCGSVCSGDFTPGTVLTLTATPASGSTFAGWSGACSGTGACTVTMNASASVTATFNSTTVNYDITATAKGNGTITAVSNPNVTQGTSGDTTISVVKVAKGASQIFTITPNTGYYTDNVSVNGTVVARNVGNYSYTFSNVTANQTISATFASNSASYSITASAATSGGSISPAGTVTVSSSASKTFTIKPNNSQFRISDVKVNGVSKGAISSYTFSGITANQTIQAYFSKK